jgi:hypothetical protein
MKEYFDTARDAVVHHGIRALRRTLACNTDCISFAVTLQNAMTPAPAMSASSPKGEKDDAGTENTRSVVVRQALGGVKPSPADHPLPKMDVAELVIKKVLRCAADRKKLSVALPGGATINYTLACAAPALYQAAVILKGAPECFDKFTVLELKEFAATKLAEIYSVRKAVSAVVEQLLADDDISLAAKHTILAASSSITEMSFGVVTSVCGRYKSLVVEFFQKVQACLESGPLKGLAERVEKKDPSCAADQSDLLGLVKTEEAKDVNIMWKDVGGVRGRWAPRAVWGTRRQSLLWLRTERTRGMDSLDDGKFGARVHLGSWCVALA